jgi:hypothetical protein
MMAETAESKPPKESASAKESASVKESKPLTWRQILLIWSAIAFGVLFAGGAAIRALSGLTGSTPDFDGMTFWLPLSVFSVGGGVAIGLVILTWWFVVKRGSFSWTIGFVLVAVVLFALYVWPSPYRYDKDWNKNATCRVLQIQRWTGETKCVLPVNPATPAQSS